MHFTTLFTTITLFSAALINAYDPVKMLCLVNKERTRSGLKPLGLSQQLQNAAQKHSDDQARMRSMTHNGSDGSSPGDRVERAGYNWRSVAENVAYGYGDEEECMKEWMNSSGHRKNILGRDYTHFGSAVGYAGSTPYYTQDFGGDGQSHNFPECPSGGSYGDSGNDSGNDSGSNDYESTSPSKSYGGKKPSNSYDTSPSKSYGGKKPSKSYGSTSPSKSYGGKKPSNSYDTSPSKSYGGKKPSNSYDTSPSYGSKSPSKTRSGRKVTTYDSNTRYGNKKHKRHHRRYRRHSRGGYNGSGGY